MAWHNALWRVVREDYASLEGPVGVWDDGLPRKHDEAGDVAGIILDAVGKHLEAVELGGMGGGDDGGVTEPARGDVLSGAGGVIEGLVGNVELRGVESELALHERLRS